MANPKLFKFLKYLSYTILSLSSIYVAIGITAMVIAPLSAVALLFSPLSLAIASVITLASFMSSAIFYILTPEKNAPKGDLNPFFKENKVLPQALKKGNQNNLDFQFNPAAQRNDQLYGQRANLQRAAHKKQEPKPIEPEENDIVNYDDAYLNQAELNFEQTARALGFANVEAMLAAQNPDNAAEHTLSKEDLKALGYDNVEEFIKAQAAEAERYNQIRKDEEIARNFDQLFKDELNGNEDLLKYAPAHMQKQFKEPDLEPALPKRPAKTIYDNSDDDSLDDYKPEDDYNFKYSDPTFKRELDVFYKDLVEEYKAIRDQLSDTIRNYSDHFIFALRDFHIHRKEILTLIYEQNSPSCQHVPMHDQNLKAQFPFLGANTYKLLMHLEYYSKNGGDPTRQRIKDYFQAIQEQFYTKLRWAMDRDKLKETLDCFTADGNTCIDGILETTFAKMQRTIEFNKFTFAELLETALNHYADAIIESNKDKLGGKEIKNFNELAAFVIKKENQHIFGASTIIETFNDDLVGFLFDVIPQKIKDNIEILKDAQVIEKAYTKDNIKAYLSILGWDELEATSKPLLSKAQLQNKSKLVIDDANKPKIEKPKRYGYGYGY